MATMPDDVKAMLRERAAASKRPKLRTMTETDAGAALDWYLDTFGDEGRRKSINLLGRFGVKLHTRKHYIGGGGQDRSRVIFPDARKSVVYPDDFVDLVVHRDMMPTEVFLQFRDFAPMDGHGLLASWMGVFWKMPRRSDDTLAKMVREAGADAMIATGLRAVRTGHRSPMRGWFNQERWAYKLDFVMAMVQFFSVDLSQAKGGKLSGHIRIASPSDLEYIAQ